MHYYHANAYLYPFILSHLVSAILDSHWHTILTIYKLSWWELQSSWRSSSSRGVLLLIAMVTMIWMIRKDFLANRIFLRGTDFEEGAFHHIKETFCCGNDKLCIWGGVEKRHLCLCLRISEVYEFPKRMLTRDGWNISFTWILNLC